MIMECNETQRITQRWEGTLSSVKINPFSFRQTLFFRLYFLSNTPLSHALFYINFTHLVFLWIYFYCETRCNVIYKKCCRYSLLMRILTEFLIASFYRENCDCFFPRNFLLLCLLISNKFFLFYFSLILIKYLYTKNLMYSLWKYTISFYFFVLWTQYLL